jgi:beta-galactosidase
VRRSVTTLNSGWLFLRSDTPSGGPPTDTQGWDSINLPHTWNAKDLIADEPIRRDCGSGTGEFAGYGASGDVDYYRGVAWYHRALPLDDADQQRRIFLRFDGANQDAVVYVNGREAGRHLGGYTGFCIDITPQLRSDGRNTISVRLSNAHNEDVAPIGGDLGHFGGIYRPVRLIKTHPVHFDVGHYGGPGLLVDTPQFTGEAGTVRVRGRVRNDGPSPRAVRVVSSIRDADGNVVAQVDASLKAASGAAGETCAESIPIERPHLWSPDDPYLYTVQHELQDAETGEVLDEEITPLGFRWFSVDADEGFFLNGQRCFIRGIGRHQDYAGLGYAVPREVLLSDTREVKALGANLMRSHYPLAGDLYAECDRLGLLCWVKMPIMDKIGQTPAFRENAGTMLREVVLQFYNHPSIVMWGHMCEVLGDADWFWPKPQDPEHLATYQEAAREMTQHLHDLTKQLDPSRLVGNDFHMDPSPQWYRDSGLTEINDFNAWNLYHGWYHADLDRLPEALKQTRAFAPDRPYLIAEYGAGTDRRLHAHEPTIYDMTPEYADRFHKAYLAEVAKHPWIAGMSIWTLADFQRNSIGDTMKHINNKGMLSGDRERKDTFYLYKAYWNPEPMVRIAEHDWSQRVAVCENGETVRAPLQVYTNLSEVELSLDGVSLGGRASENHSASWKVPFHAGVNHLRVVGRKGEAILEDSLEIDYQFIPADLRTWDDPSQKLCINVGQSRVFFRDPLSGDRWLPDRAFSPGAFGYRDGRFRRIWRSSEAWDGIREGVRQTIRNTDLDPVFQTFLVGITSYRLDVPDGRYRVGLYFTEPFPEAVRQTPEEQTGAHADGRRVFRVSVNDCVVFDALDLAKDYGERVAVVEHVDLVVEEGRGIEIGLAPLAGEAVLSGVTVTRN